jgi:hypothetical protein
VLCLLHFEHAAVLCDVSQQMLGNARRRTLHDAAALLMASVTNEFNTQLRKAPV